jgi:hypothetical protein
MAACAQHGGTDAELLLIMGPEPSEDYDIALPLGATGNNHA